MNHVKWFTQRITLILVTVIVLTVAFILAQLMQLAGILRFVDSLYQSRAVVFWMLMLITRLIFLAGWIFVVWYIIDRGKSMDFFWFKPEEIRYKSNKSDQIDQSWIIAGLLVMFAFAFIIAEFTIRIATWTNPFYMLPLS